MIYLDFAATTPMSEDALYVFNEASKRYFGNASSLHEFGTQANDALEASRSSWAQMINAEKDGIYFTSGGTESNQLAIRSLIEGNRDKGNHLITTDAEHSSVYNVMKKLEGEGFEVTYLSIHESGQISIEELKAAIRPSTILASIQAVNGEVGYVQAISEIGELLDEANVLFHTDAVQAFTNIPLDVQADKIDALSISGHKIYGPKGIGLCYINSRVSWKPQVPNTTHEGGLRAGTVDVPAILSFTTAAQQLINSMNENAEKMTHLRQHLLEKLKETKVDFTLYESELNQVPQIVGMAFSKLQGQYIMLECNKNGLAISTGSACQVGQQSPPRTLLSLRKTRDEANQFVRISFGITTTVEELDALVTVLEKIVHNLS